LLSSPTNTRPPNGRFAGVTVAPTAGNADVRTDALPTNEVVMFLFCLKLIFV
jgi:hypothetical protein